MEMDGLRLIALIFLFATNIKGKPVFEVNGNNYEPTGYTFYNAELISGGTGGGT
ncbi:hypothetical protein B1A_00071, partial [mine drainage metagenome]